MQVVNSEKAPAAVGPYSQAVKAGGFLYLSGQTGMNPQAGALAPGGSVEQMKQALENCREVLKAAGADFKDVVKTTVFLTDMDEFAAVNEVYKQYFATPYPARSCVQVSRLPVGALVEIELVALLP